MQESSLASTCAGSAASRSLQPNPEVSREVALLKPNQASRVSPVKELLSLRATLRAAYCLLQMAHLLLQSGKQAEEVESEGAKEKVGRVSVACQTDHDQEEPEESAESEETADSEASRGVALLKANLEKDMEQWDVSSG